MPEDRVPASSVRRYDPFLDQGVLARATFLPSPNFDERPPGIAVSLAVIHNISLPPGQYDGAGVPDLFLNRLNCDSHPYYDGLRGLRVSSHFFIRRDGRLLQFVPCDLRAWHAGQSRWRGQERCNDFSIGIELEGSDFDLFADPQYDQLSRLIVELKLRYPIADLAGHSEISPGRKTDPGPHFDWHRVGRPM